MNENELLRNVLKAARDRGWLAAHFGSSVKIVGKERKVVGDRDAAGFPDLVLCRDNELIFAELKGHSGWGLTFAQREWIKRLERVRHVCWDGEKDVARVDMQVWVPEDLDVIYRRLV